MKAQEWKQAQGWSAEERAAKLKEWTQALFNLRIQKATGQLENPMRIPEVRRDIARLKTLDAAESRKAAGGTGR